MKTSLLFFIGFLSAGTLAANPLLPFTFETGKIALPHLSLRDFRPSGPISVLPKSSLSSQALRLFGRSDLNSDRKGSKDRLTSQAPLFRSAPGQHPMIKRPDNRFDYKLIVEPPDDAYDYKLLIKVPKPDTAK